MTAAEHIAALHALMQAHGGQLPLYFVDPQTGQRWDVQVTTGLAPPPEGVYLALVPVVPGAREGVVGVRQRVEE